MTLAQYIVYALAKKQIEYHSYSANAKNQCVDLVNDFIEKVWDLTPIIGTNAKDFPEKLTQGMVFIPNTVEYLPSPGEIAVWNGRVGGGAGHIAVVTKKGLQTTFKSLDQNWSKKEFITEETHSYSNVRGFIRNVSSTQEEMSKELEACLAQHKDLIDQLEAQKKLTTQAQTVLGEEKIKHQETKTELELVKKDFNDASDEHAKDLERIAVLLDVKAEMSQILPAIETCITYEDKAREADQDKKELEEKHEADIKALDQAIDNIREDFTSYIHELEKKLKAAEQEIERLKKEKPATSPPVPQKSIIEIILGWFGK